VNNANINELSSSEIDEIDGGLTLCQLGYVLIGAGLGGALGAGLGPAGAVGGAIGGGIAGYGAGSLACERP
jgi:hypothetical protein